MEYNHIPVMMVEALDFLNLKKGGFYIDGTLGGAGYTREIALKTGKEGKVMSFDLDQWAIENAKELLDKKKIDNVILVNDNFSNIYENAQKHFGDIKNFDKGIFSGIVFDLGLSNAQLEDISRGFSFKNDSPLMMSFSQSEKDKTINLLNTYSREELEKILRDYGEEKFYKKIVDGIFNARKSGEISTTSDLVKIIELAVPAFYRRQKIHPATKTFQALRIYTNDELASVEKGVQDSIPLLKKGGRLVVISYHSLEDRIVKKIFKEATIDCICPKDFPVCRCEHRASVKIINKKILLPTEEEVIRNSKARSAKMRVAEKI